MSEQGNDGLTDAERAAYAESWRNGAGRTPSKDEMKRLRRGDVANQSEPDWSAFTDKEVAIKNWLAFVSTAPGDRITRSLDAEA